MFDTVLKMLNMVAIVVMSGAIIVFMMEMSAKRVVAYYTELWVKNRPKEPIPNGSNSITMRLQAFERLTIFLERINPYSLVVRLNSTGESATELQYELIQTVRQEFEHNVSQQIYVSPEAWELVKNAKEEIIQIINNVANSLPLTASSLDLSQALMSVMIDQGETVSSKAIDVIKKEANIYLGFNG